MKPKELGQWSAQEAWQPWGPTEVEKWDMARIAHLYRRVGFGASETTLKRAIEVGPDRTLQEILAPSVDIAPFEEESAGIAKSVKAGGDAKNLTTWWLHRMRTSPHPLLEKMTLFWHGHFATGAEKVLDVELMHEQNQLLRSHALGDFRSMVHGISKDPAMLIYLDSITNRKAHANENYARELMELFCLGEGNYSEMDVQQLARCFTGWEIRRKQFRFNRYQHDFGTKELLGATNIETGEEAIEQVLAQKELPYFIANKVFRFFICDEPGPSRELLEPLADRFAQDGLRISGMVETLIRSRLFLSDWSIGRKIRSPIELAIGFLTTLESTANFESLSQRLREVGQAVFFPPNVKGWDGGRAWINSSTLVGRANLLHQLIRDENTRFQGGSLIDFASKKKLASAEPFLDWIENHFFASRIREKARKEILEKVSMKSGLTSYRELISLLAATPEIHLS